MWALGCVITAAVLLTSGCGTEGSGGWNEAVGPDLTEVRTAEDVARSIGEYEGPFEVEARSADGADRSTIRFDGTNWSHRQIPAVPIEEWRVVSSDGTTRCFEHVGGRWVWGTSEGSREQISLARAIEVASPGAMPSAAIFLSDAEFDVDVEDDSVVIRVQPPFTGPDQVDRVELRVDGGALLSGQFLSGDELKYTQTYAFEEVDEVGVPTHAEEGIDVTC